MMHACMIKMKFFIDEKLYLDLNLVDSIYGLITKSVTIMFTLVNVYQRTFYLRAPGKFIHLEC